MDPKRILIVDDEAGSSRLLKANLELAGPYEVRVENCPEMALEVARQFKPNVALLDVIMPNISGTSLALAFLEDPDLKFTRIIFLTAAAAPLMTEDVMLIMCRFPCVFKPATIEDILFHIESI